MSRIIVVEVQDAKDEDVLRAAARSCKLKVK